MGPLVRGEAQGLARLSELIGQACEDVGFFYIVNHGVSSEMVRRTFEDSRRFHALSLDEKRRLAINRFHRGYIELASYRLTDDVAPNLSESIVLMHELSPDDPRLVAGLPLQGPNQWPSLKGWRSNMLDYVAAMETVARHLLSAFACALALPDDYFHPMFARPTTFLRLLHYPPQDERTPENQFGAAPHTDYGALTMLAQDDVGGLHVRHRSGEWVAAPPVKDAFVVNIGDVMARWTNDRFVSTPHRVVNITGRERYSIPFFFDPDMAATVRCLDSCQGPDRPPRYDPITYGDYLLGRLDAHYAYRKTE